MYIFDLIKCFLYSATCTASATSTKIELSVQACLYVSAAVSELNLVSTPCSVLRFKQTLLGS